MYCRYCGKEVPGDSVFCAFCRKQLNDDTSQPETTTYKKDNVVAKPQTRAVHKRPTTTDNSIPSTHSMGVLSWLFLSYGILIITLLLLGMIGVATSVDVPNKAFTFRNSSIALISTAAVLLGKYAVPVGAPAWFTYILPITFLILPLVFAIIQAVKNKNKFSTITLVSVISVTVIIIFLQIFLPSLISNVLMHDSVISWVNGFSS